MTDPKLTPAQSRYLKEIRDAGEKTYNGRAMRVIEALDRLNLVTAHYDLRPNCGSWSWVIKVRPI